MQAVALAERRCQSCTGIKDPLPTDEVERLMREISPAWQIARDGKQIERELKFANFADAMAFLNQVAAVSEEEDHHPDFYLWAWNRVRLIQFTYVVDGLSQNDFIMAAKFDALADAALSGKAA